MTGTNSEVLIKVVDLHKSFGKLDVLKGVNTEIHRGEVVSLMGPSGGGGNRQYPPSCGRSSGSAVNNTL